MPKRKHRAPTFEVGQLYEYDVSKSELGFGRKERFTYRVTGLFHNEVAYEFVKGTDFPGTHRLRRFLLGSDFAACSTKV